MPEQDPTQSRVGALMERAGAAIGNGIENIRQSANTLKAVGKIAGLGVGVSLGLVGVASAEEQPIRTPDVPTAEAPATYSGTTAEVSAQTCVNPNVKIKNPVLSGPKKFNDGSPYRNQRADISYEAMPEGCEPEFTRYLYSSLQTKSSTKPNIWRNAQPVEAFANSEADSYKLLDVITSLDPGYPECIKGPRKIKARFIYGSYLVSNETNKIVARHVTKKPVRVKAAC